MYTIVAQNHICTVKNNWMNYIQQDGKYYMLMQAFCHNTKLRLSKGGYIILSVIHHDSGYISLLLDHEWIKIAIWKIMCFPSFFITFLTSHSIMFFP